VIVMGFGFLVLCVFAWDYVEFVEGWSCMYCT
jgi:hypothetical protein